MAAAPDPTALRVLTLNVLAPAYADWPARRRVVLSELRRLRPDVVALQEVAHRADHDEATELLGPEFYLARHPAVADDGTTAVLACRWPFGTVRQIDLDLDARAREFAWGGAVVAEVLGPPSIGPLIVVHHNPVFQLGYERQRELQALHTARAVEEMVNGRAEPTHVVLLGDFDATPDAASIRFWTGRQSLEGTSVSYHDAWESARGDDPGYTFDPRNPLVRDGDMPLVRPRRIDYVMVRGTAHGPTLQVPACDLAFAEPLDGTWPSDHFGVVADLAVPPRPPGGFSARFRT